MDAVPALTLSLVAVFPGLMLYCAVYDVFCRRNNVVSTVPRDPKSVEALAVIILGSLVVHLMAILLSDLFTWPCALDLCKPMAPMAVRSGEAVLVGLATGAKGNEPELKALALTTLALGFLTYGIADRIMVTRARREALPYWLYRWTANVAISSDRQSAVMIAYVLTDIEADEKKSLYVGVVDDLALDEKFNILRIVLVDCNRHLMDVSKPGRASLAVVLSEIPKIVIDSSHILNVSFERIDL